ncbi:hypothetical protein [Roseobacter fucihabitans]|nr:hypothetical protein [Roseobacter litoralis]
MSHHIRHLPAAAVLIAAGAGATHITASDQLDLASATQSVCTAHATITIDLRMELAELGWVHPQPENMISVLRLWADGVLAVGRELRAPVDWTTAPAQAESTAIQVFGGEERDNVIRLTIGPNTAALAVIQSSGEETQSLRCIYAGPGDDNLRDLLNTLESLDERAGIKRADPHVQTFQSRTQGEEDGKPYLVDLQVARFEESAASSLGREPHVELGFSTIFTSIP